MSGIWNVVSTYNSEENRAHKKVNFNIGDKFSARIIPGENNSGELLLKLLDGWQFLAEINGDPKINPNGLLKFKVEGYKDGKLIVKLLEDEVKEKAKDLFEDILQKQGLKINKEDYELLKSMLKHNISLTKENISNAKALVDFQTRIKEDGLQEDVFITKYLDNKRIDINSPKGQNIKNILKSFFAEFKKLDVKDIFTLIENNIDFTEENILSFNKINKEPMAIYKDITDIEKIFSDAEKVQIKNDVEKGANINDSKRSANIRDTNIKEEKEHRNSDDNLVISDSKEDATSKNNFSGKHKSVNSYAEKVYSKSESIESSVKEVLNKLLDMELGNEDSVVIDGKVYEKNKEKLEHNIISKDVPKTKEEISNEALKVKQEINNKLEDIKNTIKDLIHKEVDFKSEVFKEVMSNFQSKINDFKVYNALSDQYYYLDLPVNINENEYPCKLIIKDDRKKGKKVDSTNVKLVASVNTMNIGVVDAFIHIVNKSINLDIKCDKSWVKPIDMAKNQIIDKLKTIGFVPNVTVEEKNSNVSLVECRSFFDDGEFTRIDTMV